MNAMKRFTLIAVLTAGMAALFFTGCGSEEMETASDIIWTNNNIQGVQSDPSNDTVIVLDQDYFVTAIMDYHYFNDGAKPGTISLVAEDGSKYGPWQAKGREGQGGVENAYWDTTPNVVLKAGKYTVVDSDPETWSHNDGSENAGMTEVKGYPAE